MEGSNAPCMRSPHRDAIGWRLGGSADAGNERGLHATKGFDNEAASCDGVTAKVKCRVEPT